jgi:hypothetical protein
LLQGSKLACEDLHKIIDILREKAGMTKEQVYALYEKEIQNK